MDNCQFTTGNNDITLGFNKKKYYFHFAFLMRVKWNDEWVQNFESNFWNRSFDQIW